MTIPSKQIEVDKWIPLCQEKCFGSETPTNALTGLTTKGIYHSIGYGIRFFFFFFEIVAFMNFKWGSSWVGNSSEKQKTNKYISIAGKL